MGERWLVSVIDPGCDCCSYVPVEVIDGPRSSIPAEYLNGDYTIDDWSEDD